MYSHEDTSLLVVDCGEIERLLPFMFGSESIISCGRDNKRRVKGLSESFRLQIGKALKQFVNRKSEKKSLDRCNRQWLADFALLLPPVAVSYYFVVVEPKWKWKWMPSRGALLYMSSSTRIIQG
jgi:hypothetical protein